MTKVIITQVRPQTQNSQVHSSQFNIQQIALHQAFRKLAIRNPIPANIKLESITPY